MPVIQTPRTFLSSRFAEGAANPEAKAMLDAADTAAKVRAKVAEASIPYEDRVQVTTATELAQDAAQRAKVAEAMIPYELRGKGGVPITVSDASRTDLALKDDKQGIGFNTETLFAYAVPIAVGAGVGAVVGSQAAYKKRVGGPYVGAGIGAVAGVLVSLGIQQFRK